MVAQQESMVDLEAWGHFKKCKFRIFYKKIRMAIFPIIRLRFSSGHRKWHTSFLEKSLSRNSFLDLKSCGLPPRKKDTILVRFSSSLKVSFPNFLSKNRYGDTCDKMHRLSVQKLLAFLNDLLAVILAKHTNMRLI